MQASMNKKGVRLASLKAFLGREKTAGLICVLPFMIGFFLFLVIPMLISAYYAFCDFDILSSPVWRAMRSSGNRCVLRCFMPLYPCR